MGRATKQHVMFLHPAIRVIYCWDNVPANKCLVPGTLCIRHFVGSLCCVLTGVLLYCIVLCCQAFVLSHEFPSSLQPFVLCGRVGS
jgi:hypothetical protein